jgi:hypothetical protein
MEAAGIITGVEGLLGLVALDKVDTYEDIDTESRSIALCFEEDKHRFQTWLYGVGILNNHTPDEHNQLLDDDSLRLLVVNVLFHICTLWSARHESLTAFDGADPDDADAFPGGGGTVEESRVHKQPCPTQQPVASKREKLAWALGGKAKFIARLETFGRLVNCLYLLVSPTRFRGLLTAPEVHMAAHDGKFAWL